MTGLPLFISLKFQSFYGVQSFPTGGLNVQSFFFGQGQGVVFSTIRDCNLVFFRGHSGKGRFCLLGENRSNAFYQSLIIGKVINGQKSQKAEKSAENPEPDLRVPPETPEKNQYGHKKKGNQPGFGAGEKQA